MTRPQTRAAVDRIAAAVRDQALAAGSTNAARGSDWRLATVATVGTDGTITTTDGIVARRQATYGGPEPGDVITVSLSSAGAWRAEGPLVPATGDAWIPVTGFSSPWANYTGSGGFQTARYRMYPDGDVAIEGLVTTGATSVSGTTTVFTLPAGYRPLAAQVRCALATGNAARQLEVAATGTVRFSNLPSGAVGFVTLAARFSTL